VNPGRAGLLGLAVAAFLAVAPPQAVRGASSGGPASFDPSDLKEWLSYIASDDLQGRAVFSTRAANSSACATSSPSAPGHP